jgi:hypothetical protein
MPDTIPGGPHPTGNDTGVTQGSSQRHHSDSGAVAQGWFQQLQALEDAIAYRRARAAAPCPDCTADGRRCDDHACDLHLIAAYQQTAIAAIQDMSSRIHAAPADHDHGTFAAACDADVP